ncbi:MAG: MarR family transcriptional regulator [Anaerolineaceae bacterium]|nr:MarR family transcriptional regulator [Anaerolineaceae bacterium]
MNTVSKPESFPTQFETPDQSPGFLVWQVANDWQHRQRLALKKLGLTHVQFVLLACTGWLNQSSQPVSQVRLATYAHLDIMMTSQVLRTLEKKGLVERASHPTDPRAKSIRLTAAGQSLITRALPVVEETDRQFFDILGDQRPHWVQLLSSLLRAHQTPP